MSLYFAEGSPTTKFSDSDLRSALDTVFERLGTRQRVLAIPPDFTRFHSRAGTITSMVYDHFADTLTDIMPRSVRMTRWKIGKSKKCFQEYRPN